MKINKEKITKEFCKGKILLFFPENQAQAQYIGERLLEMNFQLNKKRQPDFIHGDGWYAFVRLGMVLGSDGKLSKLPQTSEISKGVLCTYDQLDDSYVPELDAAALMEKFNTLSARVEQMAKLVEEMHKEIMPHRLHKPGFKRTEP